MTSAVVDASAIVDFLRATPLGDKVAARLTPADVELHLPHLCPIEVTSALRGLVLAGKIPAEGAAGALLALDLVQADRHAVEPHLPRIWELRNNLTVHDATYVALAESLGCPLLTTDRKFDTPAVRRLIDVEVIS